jgi:hypothetical protein
MNIKSTFTVIALVMSLFTSFSMAQAPAADKDALLAKVTAAINPEADGDRKELFRKGLAALADLNTAGTKPEDSLSQAKAKGSLSGEKTEKMSKMLMEMWSLNTPRMTEPATLDALRKGEMPEPALKRP